MTPNPTDSPSSSCGCGGHDHMESKAQEPHAGCGCHPAPPPNDPKPHSCGGGCRGIRRSRRLHAALGVLLLGFLFLHLGVASLGWVPARYDRASAWLRYLSETLPFLEVLLLMAVALQVLVGVKLLLRAGLGYSASRCKEDDRGRYYLQRWSALILLIFVILHVVSFKLWPVGSVLAEATGRFTLGGNPLMIAFSFLAVVALAFHLGNGLWTGASVWGVRELYPRLFLFLALAIGGVIALLGLNAWAAFTR